MYAQIIAGIIAGIGYAFAGWQKTDGEEGSDLDWIKLVKTTLICAIVGGIAGYMNSDFNLLLTGTIGIGITKIVSVLVSIWENKTWPFIKQRFSF